MTSSASQNRIRGTTFLSMLSKTNFTPTVDCSLDALWLGNLCVCSFTGATKAGVDRVDKKLLIAGDGQDDDSLSNSWSLSISVTSSSFQDGVAEKLTYILKIWRIQVLKSIVCTQIKVAIAAMIGYNICWWMSRICSLHRACTTVIVLLYAWCMCIHRFNIEG